MGGQVRLAELQLAIMNVLWDQGEATVAQVRESLEAANRPLAHTTIATMLSRICRDVIWQWRDHLRGCDTVDGHIGIGRCW